MKKLIFLLIASLAFFMPESKSQTLFGNTVSNPNGLITNTSIDTLLLRLAPSYTEALGVQVTVTRATGTMAGTAVLLGSIDGINYVSAGDTLTMTNQVTNTKVWKIDKPIYRNLLVKIGGATTVTGSARAFALALKP